MFLCYNRRFHDKDCAVTVPGCFTGLKGKCTKIYEQVYFDGVVHLEVQEVQAGFKIPAVTNVLSLDESFNPSISLSAINLAGVAVSC